MYQIIAKSEVHIYVLHAGSLNSYQLNHSESHIMNEFAGIPTVKTFKEAMDLMDLMDAMDRQTECDATEADIY